MMVYVCNMRLMAAWGHVLLLCAIFLCHVIQRYGPDVTVLPWYYLYGTEYAELRGIRLTLLV